MLEHITRGLYYFEVHLLYASVVFLAAWLLTSLRGVSPTVKYWIWVATSLNFVLPVGAMLNKLWSSHLAWARPLGTIGDAAATLTHARSALVFANVWWLGAVIMLVRLCWRIRREREQALPAEGSTETPSVDGLLHPRISLPNSIERLLTASELDAVLIHESAHARRRDNLIWLIHELALCLLWFHPLVWITGWRLCVYRELSCDEVVIQRDGGDDLLSALAKLAEPRQPSLLRAGASSFLGLRIAQLAASKPARASGMANAMVSVLFGLMFAAGIFATIAHTACCFLAKHS